MAENRVLGELLRERTGGLTEVIGQRLELDDLGS